MRTTILLIAFASIGLSACSNTDDPQLAMCQAVAKQLTRNTVTSWDGTERKDGNRAVTVQVNYTNAADQSGSLDCVYPKSADGTVATAPKSAVFNGTTVGSSTLISAGTKASKEILTGAYKETVAKSAELAEEAKAAAADFAEKAKVVASEGVKTLQELQK